MQHTNPKNKKINTKELALFSVLGSIMYISKILMEWIPNVHLLGVFTIVFTAVYRKKALMIIYVYVFLVGLTNGFTLWWYPNLYLWFILWCMAILVPQQWSPLVRGIVYMIICGLHGFLYGTLYAPFQAIVFGMNWEALVTWIIAGLPFDMIHGIGNFCSAILVMPLIKVLNKLERL